MLFSRASIVMLFVLFVISGCSTNNPSSNSVNSEVVNSNSFTTPPKGKGALIAYYPHSGSLLQGFTWFQPFIINGKNAGNIQPHKHIVCHLSPGTYVVSTTSGGFGLPNSLREKAQKEFTVVAGETTFVQFNVNMGAHRSSVRIVPGSISNAATTKPGDKCKI